MESVDIPLLKALENPNVSLEELENAISNGADVNAETEDGTTPIMVAAHFCVDVNIIKKLLEHGANINARTVSYESFIMRKAISKQDKLNLDPDNIPDKIIKKIHNDFNAILNSSEIRYTDGAIVEGSALLYAAKYNNNLSIIECLLNNGADISVVDEEGKNALMFAAQYNTNPQIIKLLIEKYGKEADLDAALYLACANNPSFDVFRCLINAGANTDIVWGGKSLVYIASHNQNYKILSEVMRLDKRVDWSNKRNLTKLLLYLVDSWDYNIDVIKFLIANGANANATTQSGESILEQILNHTTIDGAKDKEIIKFLIDSGAKVDSSMLHWVADSTKPGFNEILELLAQKCDDIEDVFLYLIQNTTNVSLIENLITRGVDPSLELKTKYRTVFPIVAAAKYNCSPDVIECLIRHGANPNYATKTGRTLLMEAVQHNDNPDVIQKLISCGANVNAQGYIKTALIYAVNRKKYTITDERSRLNIIDVLLKSGADVNAVDSEGNTALVYAVKNQDVDVIKLLISYNADSNIYNKLGQNSLSFVTKDQENIRCLLNSSLKRDEDDIVLAQATNLESLKKILKKSFSVDILDKALAKAVPNNANPDIIKAIIEQGADVNKIIDEENSILMLSVRNENFEVVDTLLKSGADVNLKGKNNKTALIEAIKSKASIATLRVLLEAGADVNARDKSGKTALFYSAASGASLDVFKLLLGFGADVNISSNTGETPLLKLVRTKACLETFNKKEFSEKIWQSLESINLLINSGADVNAGKHVPLMEAVRLDDVQLTQLLLDAGADISVRSKYYGSVYELAYSKEMKALLKKYQ